MPRVLPRSSSLLRDKFPGADKRLVAEANWQRHITFRKCIEQIDVSAESGSIAVTTNFIANSIFQPQTLFHDSGIGPSNLAQSCPAPPEASHTSFISTLADKETGAARIPPTLLSPWPNATEDKNRLQVSNHNA